MDGSSPKDVPFPKWIVWFAAFGLLFFVAGGLLLKSFWRGVGDSAGQEVGAAANTSAFVPTVGPSAAAPPTSASALPAELYPDVLEAVVRSQRDGTFTVEATLSSPYDSPERYADAWRVLAPDGTVLAIRELAHDHASEQPFTRSLAGVEIPADVTEVTIEGRDQRSGWGGATITLAVSR